MFYACLATSVCFSIGIGGIVLSWIDIERWNFGLYFALLSVVGTTVSAAFWIISPSACANPRWIQWIMDRYGYKAEPCRNCFSSLCTKERRRFWDDDESSINTAIVLTKRKRRSSSCPIKTRKIRLNRAWTAQARLVSAYKERTLSPKERQKQCDSSSNSCSPSAHILLAESSGQNCTDVEIV
ncbi:unnamed protein product [Cylicocyclus nassatus]|uniref:Uncharacterized protein n=1 Tax=Cylicocyclus nassatus TaxID=53992 RepID=A0AA36MD71_CYLNA|nr:unnamed protein product [Cylicocyclus nassatus]